MTTMIPCWNQILIMSIFSGCTDEFGGELGNVGKCPGGSAGKLGKWGGDLAGAAKQFGNFSVPHHDDDCQCFNFPCFLSQFEDSGSYMEPIFTLHIV